jgi:hypothetical protein
MKMKSNSAVFVLSAFLALGFYAGRAQQNGAGHASNFTSVDYFDPPHAQQIKSRLSGAEAQPLPGGLLAIKQLKLESFGEDGKLECSVSAPECVYDTMNATANSSGHLHLASGDGRFSIEGDGFLWRRNAQSLTISNRVQTVIENETNKIKP